MSLFLVKELHSLLVYFALQPHLYVDEYIRTWGHMILMHVIKIPSLSKSHHLTLLEKDADVGIDLVQCSLAFVNVSLTSCHFRLQTLSKEGKPNPIRKREYIYSMSETRHSMAPAARRAVLWTPRAAPRVRAAIPRFSRRVRSTLAGCLPMNPIRKCNSCLVTQQEIARANIRFIWFGLNRLIRYS